VKRLRVYLSSTFEDLKSHRAAVSAALEKAGLDVARMEGYTAADLPPLELCLRDVARSDVYVGMYAWRYGYIPPAGQGNPQQRSITELEYRQAERSRLRKLLFLAHPDTKAHWPDAFSDEKTGESERGTLLTAFRTELGTDKAVSFFRTPDDLATLVLAAIMRTGGGGRAFTFPPQPKGFVPRPALTAALVEAVAGNATVGVSGGHTVVAGPGGFGKTTLVLDTCYGEAMSNAFPDGMYWTTVGETPEITKLLGELYVSAAGTPPPVVGDNNIIEALGQFLGGRRSLLVIDDVWRADDLAPFLRLNGPRLLVTTRGRNLIEQAGLVEWREVPVDEMAIDEAAVLLGRRLTLDEASRARVRTLADQLGCWPLLLDLANARLVEEQKAPRSSLSSALDRVMTIFERRGVLGFDRRDSQMRNTAVRRSVDAGLDFLDESRPGLAQKAVEVSIFPEDVAIPLRVLADLWGLDEFDVEEEAIRPLDDLSIVIWDRGAGEVRVHDMIRRSMFARLADAVAVHGRLIDKWGDPHRLPYDYAWRWFAWHGVNAQRQALVGQLLADYDWLRVKLEATDVQALLSDFDVVRGEGHLEVIRDALRLSAHVLARNKAKLAGQLLARLPEREAPLRDVIRARSAESPTPWLRPLRPSLEPPGGPLVRTLEGHTAGITSVVVTRDGRCAVSASYDHSVRTWDLDRGEALRTLGEPGESVGAIVLMPDNRRVMSAADDGTVKIWDLETGRSLRTLTGPAEGLTCIALTADGRGIVTGGYDRAVHVWDLESGTIVRTLEGHLDTVGAVAVTSDGRVVSGSGDSTLKIWDLRSGQELRTLPGHAGGINALAITPGDRYLVSSGSDRTIKIWDPGTGVLLRTLPADVIAAMAFNSDGSRIVSAGASEIAVWDLASGTAVRRFGGHAGGFTAIAVIADGRRVVTGSYDQTLRVWDVDRDDAGLTLDRHSLGVRAIKLTHDGRHAVSASYDTTLKVWDVERAQCLRTLVGHTSAVDSVALTADGSRAVSGGSDGTVRIWDVEHGVLLYTLEGHTQSVNNVEVSPDGRIAVSTSFDRTVRVWDIERGAMRHVFEGHEDAIDALALSPDGTRALSGGREGAVKVWEVRFGVLLAMLTAHAGWVLDIAVTADGTRIVSAGADQALKVWDAASGDLLATLEGHQAWVGLVAVSPDGTRAVSASSDQTLKLWDLERYRLLHTLQGHTASVMAVALLPDAMRAASASLDKTVAVWDLRSGEVITTFGTDADVTVVRVSPAGTIVAGDGEGRMHFLKLEDAHA
jgi:WD40 repeat protein